LRVLRKNLPQHLGRANLRTLLYLPALMFLLMMLYSVLSTC
jgi:hypothetical protein